MTSKPHSEQQLLVMNLGAKERAEAAVNTLKDRGESAKQPSLLTALGHDVLLALAIIERLEEQLEIERQERADFEASQARLLEQLEAAQRDLANTVYERDMHVRVGMEAERHLRGIAEAYDAARVDESARVMYDIARSSVPQRDDQGHILDPEWAERMIERWMPSNPAKRCPNCGGDAGDNWFNRSLCFCEEDGVMHTRCKNCGQALDFACSTSNQESSLKEDE